MEKFQIGGVLVTAMEVTAAITKLEAVGGTAIAQPLRAIGNPLATCEYHKVAKATSAERDRPLIAMPLSKSAALGTARNRTIRATA